ncbi:hypothetical protein B0H14DRAFT_3157101 [Mycena olivaceomarginata]|nr:hypothetical protein B0H14DRAFT_3157101 [Mycena olivaceomarginata]
MPLPNVTQNRLDNVVICLTMTTNSLQIIADSMTTPFLGAIINTTQAVLKNIRGPTKGEQSEKLLPAGEMSTLLKDCQAGLQQSFDFFQIEETRALPDCRDEERSQKTPRILDMIENSLKQLLQKEHPQYDIHLS